MTPRNAAALAAAVLLLNVSLAFENLWPTPAIIWRGTLSIECAIAIAALAWIAGRASSGAALRRPGRWIAVAWVVLVLGRYAQVTAPALYGRDISLYWDLRFVPDVVAMGTRVAPWWLIAVTVAAIAAVLGAMFVAIHWAVRTVAAAAASSVAARRTLMWLSAAAIGLFVAQQTMRLAPEVPAFATAVTPSYARQIEFVAQAMRRTTLVPASPAFDSNLRRVKDADVVLLFVEAYGAASFDRPHIAAALAEPRRAFDATIHETGRQVVSAFVESPTFGGSSWLAHLTLMSGVEVHDADTNGRLMAEQRDTLPRLFSRNGYRTVAMMPGLKRTWPEGAFYGFDRIYGAEQIGYHGPEFGWFAVPDQFTLDVLRRDEINRASRQRLFVFFPTISTHFPFSPTPPYQPDWSRLSANQPYDAAVVDLAYEDQPDWTDFAPGYARAMTYDFASIAGFLRQQADTDMVIVMLGDHQPAAVVSGAGARWDVPVHVIANAASREPVLARLRAHGFVDGLAPQSQRSATMAQLLPILLDAFGDPPAR
jgi:hypothetical protein